MKVLIRNNAARVFILRGRIGQIIKSITLPPSGKGNTFIEVEKADWNLVKNQALVIQEMNNGNIVVKNADGTEDVTPAAVKAAPLSANALVSKKADMENEVDKLMKSGDLDAIAAKYPDFMDAVKAKMEKKNANDSPPSDDDKTELPENITALMDSLNGKNADEIKKALREYGKAKHDVNYGNSGVDTMIEAIKELEANGD